MIFEDIDITLSENINIIIGENSIGKTVLLKTLYALPKAIKDTSNGKTTKTKEQTEEKIVSKLQGVFTPDENMIGRLVGRKQGSNRAEISIGFKDKKNCIDIAFGNRQEKHVEILGLPTMPIGINTEYIYIPPKEIISSTENFTSLYEQYHIAFEETYYDLAKLLDRPLKKGPNTSNQNEIMKNFEQIMDGKVIQRDKKFYLKLKGSGEFEMGLLSEGYRKLATIMYLILSGGLNKDSILFWDEPETNMNPKMIKPLCDAIIALANMGVQIFITTHDYFVQQTFNLLASYNSDNLDVNFISLYKNDLNKVDYECARRIEQLSHNAIMEEFDALYNREQELFYEDKRK